MKLIGEAFIEMIKRYRPEAKPASGRSEVIIKCPFCGDSDGRHNHFYISVPQSEAELSLYDCKRAICGAHGIVTEEVLRRIGCSDAEYLIAMTQHNSVVMKYPQHARMRDIDIFPLVNQKITDNPITQLKLKYINERLGLNLSFQDVLDKKIFLNLFDVLDINRLTPTREDFIVEQLNSHFIGFISYDNAFACMRQVFSKNILPQINYKYINYRIASKEDEAKNFYVIPSSVILSDQTPVRVHVTEGVFDILSVFYNLNNANNMQSIYISSAGKSYQQALQFALEQCGCFNYEIHIYPDNDVPDWQLNRLIINRIRDLPCNIYIHRNTFNDEKDFGVPKDRIIDSIQLLQEMQYV